jgi:hypothetical protein
MRHTFFLALGMGMLVYETTSPRTAVAAPGEESPRHLVLTAGGSAGFYDKVLGTQIFPDSPSPLGRIGLDVVLFHSPEFGTWLLGGSFGSGRRRQQSVKGMYHRTRTEMGASLAWLGDMPELTRRLSFAPLVRIGIADVNISQRHSVANETQVLGEHETQTLFGAAGLILELGEFDRTASKSLDVDMGINQVALCAQIVWYGGGQEMLSYELGALLVF